MISCIDFTNMVSWHHVWLSALQRGGWGW